MKGQKSNPGYTTSEILALDDLARLRHCNRDQVITQLVHRGLRTMLAPIFYAENRDELGQVVKETGTG